MEQSSGLVVTYLYTRVKHMDTVRLNTNISGKARRIAAVGNYRDPWSATPAGNNVGKTRS